MEDDSRTDNNKTENMNMFQDIWIVVICVMIIFTIFIIYFSYDELKRMGDMVAEYNILKRKKII